MPTISVKVYRNNEIRRFQLSDDNGRFKFNHLINAIQQLYPNLDLNTKLAWKDNDNEIIIMCTNTELAEAIRNLSTDSPILRIHLITTGHTTDHTSPLHTQPQEHQPIQRDDKTNETTEDLGLRNQEIPANPDVHRNIICDGCDLEIHSIRYKCLTCPDFDLCSNCIGTHDQHPMIRIVSPDDDTWKPAFLAAQTHGSPAGDHYYFFGHGHCRRGKHHKSERVHQTEGQTKDETGEQGNFEELQLPILTEEVVRNLTETIGNVLDAFSIQMSHQTTETTCTEAVSNDATTHADTKIAAALNYMSTMGYRNDGGWLTKLLQDKGGDISAVLDMIHPRKQN